MAADKAWGELDGDADPDTWSHLCLGSVEVDRWRISWGEKRKWPHAGWSVWGHACMPLFTMPSKGGHAGTFEVRDHPAGSLKTCRCWTFMPLAESYSIFIQQLMCIFEGGTPRNIFCLAQLLREGSPAVLGLSTLLLLWRFNLTL